MVGGQAPQPKADELQPHTVKDQLPNISYYSTSPPAWPEAILLGFQHYLVMLGTTVLIPTSLVPQMGGGNAACKNAPDSSEAKRAVDLLYDTALISSGFTPDSPAELGGKIYEMMAIALGGRWGRLDSDAAANSEVKAEADSKANPEAGSSETLEPGVDESSEVRTESDPWRE